MGEAAFAKQPELVKLMAWVVFKWTILETHTALLFTTLLPADQQLAADVYNDFFDTSLRAKVFLTVAKQKLTTELYEQVVIYQTAMAAVAKSRNKVAHGLWCWSADAPNALCTVKQSSVIADFRKRLECFLHDSKAVTTHGLYCYEASITTYTSRDFMDIVGRMEKVSMDCLHLAAKIAAHVHSL